VGVYTLEITFYRKLANKLADAVVGNQEYSDAEAKRIRYGLVCIFSDLYKFVLFLIIFSIFSLTKDFLIAFIGILLLRPFLGGFHAKNEITCIFMSFAMVLISILIGDMNIMPYYFQVILIILLPIMGIIIAPVNNKKDGVNIIVLKLLTGIITAVTLIMDFYLLNNQILTVCIIQIYLLSLYQMYKFYLVTKKNNEL